VPRFNCYFHVAPRVGNDAESFACDRLIAIAAFVAICALGAACNAENPADPSDSPPNDSRTIHAEPTKADVAQWIKDLSSDAFSLRQDAAARLLSAGSIAREPLRQLADGTDPETRASARRLIALIDRSEFRHRLEAFAADTDGKKGLTLPGWAQYQKLVGSDAASRTLFVEMQRQEGPLIAAILDSPKRPPEELWESRLVRIAQWQNPNGERAGAPPVGSSAAMLFIGSLPEMNITNAAASFVHNIIQRPPVNAALLPDGSQPALRKLVVNWVLQCPNKSEEVLRERLSIIQATNLVDALPLAVQACSNDPQFLHITPLTKALAVLTIGQLGSRQNVPQLEPLLDDASMCLPAQVQVPGQAATSVELRDVALVTILTLTDQAPSDYGYTAARMATPRMFQLQTLYRDNDAQRAEAVAKWREWRAHHPDALKSDIQPAPAGGATK
jgi:hypothetical protein